MLKRSVLTVVMLFAFAALVGCSAEAEKADAKDMDADAQMVAAEMPEVAVVGQAAPDFTLTSADGKEVSLSDYKGKYVVLEWVNFDCPFVRKHYGSGNMQALQTKYTGNDAVWLSICSSAPGKQGNFSGEALTSRIASENSHATAYLIDETGKVGRMYEAKTTPHMFVISPEGTLIYAGAIDDKPSTKQEDVAGATNYVDAAFNAVSADAKVKEPMTTPYGCSVKY
jgi:peroxiredoxin